MTCIVAIADKGDVYIGGDSAGVAGLSISIRNDWKVFTNQCFVIGCTTSFRMIDLLRFKLNPPQQTVSQTDHQYMATSFIDEVKEMFIKNDYGCKSGERGAEGGTFLVGYRGKLYLIHDDFQVGIPATPYYAVGCGTDLALGSLYSTQGLIADPQKRIIKALESATEFNGGVRSPYNIVKLEGAKSVKKNKTPLVRSKNSKK